MRIALVVLLSIVPATCPPHRDGVGREGPRVVEVRADSALVQLQQGSRAVCKGETGPRCMARLY